MTGIEIDDAIRAHTRWRRQFMNAFAGGSYADMPLSEHRGCTLATKIAAVPEFPEHTLLAKVHARFHSIADEIVELNQNGMADSADLLLPELTEVSYRLFELLGHLREFLAAR